MARNTTYLDSRLMVLADDATTKVAKVTGLVGRSRAVDMCDGGSSMSEIVWSHECGRPSGYKIIERALEQHA
jgi:hypothetical protein